MPGDATQMDFGANGPGLAAIFSGLDQRALWGEWEGVVVC